MSIFYHHHLPPHHPTDSKSAPSRSNAGTCFAIPRIGNFGNSGLKSGSAETPGQDVSSGVPRVLRGTSIGTPLENGEERADLAVLGEEREPVHELGEDTSQRPDVDGGRVVRTAQKDLRSAIPPRDHLVRSVETGKRLGCNGGEGRRSCGRGRNRRF